MPANTRPPEPSKAQNTPRNSPRSFVCTCHVSVRISIAEPTCPTDGVPKPDRDVSGDTRREASVRRHLCHGWDPWMLMRGSDPRYVQQQLGHEWLSTTYRYYT